MAAAALGLLLLALAAPTVATGAAGPDASALEAAAQGSKHACPVDDRLCAWPAAYALGAVVVGDKAIFHGGLFANDPATPIPGSMLQLLDLRTMAPLTVAYTSNLTLGTERYRHHLAEWRGQLLAVGGQVDSSSGASRSVLNVLALDLNTRTWRSIKDFEARPGIEYIFDAAVVAGDALLVSFQKLDPAEPARLFLALNLTTAVVDANYPLMDDPLMLDWLVGILPLDETGAMPYLVLQAQRSLPSASERLICLVVDGGGEKGSTPATCTASSKLKRLPGGSGGSVLALSIVQVSGAALLVMLANSQGEFAGRTGGQRVLLLSVHEVLPTAAPGGNISVSLQLQHVFVMPPLGVKLAALRVLDLPLLGRRAVTPSVVTELPYVGQVDLISSGLDTSNVNIQATASGVVVRGSGLADPSCQLGAPWQPFVYKLDFASAGRPAAAAAVSANTWCTRRLEQMAARQLVLGFAAVRAGQLLRVPEAGDGPALLALGPPAIRNAGNQLTFANTSSRHGAFISLRHGRASSFNASAPRGTPLAESGSAGCVTSLGDRQVYVEAGGTWFDSHEDQLAGVFAVDAGASAGAARRTLAAVAGADAVPPRAGAALACAPGGVLYYHGGLELVSKQPRGPLLQSSWVPRSNFHTFTLGGSAAKPSFKDGGPVSSGGSPAPSARSGHALAYLPASAVASLDMREGALLLFGGSDLPGYVLEDLFNNQGEDNITAQVQASTWDRTPWLYDLAAGSWQQLDVRGNAPPGLSHHAMAVHGQQAIIFGGHVRDPASLRVSSVLPNQLHVLDFSEAPPLWRTATLSGIQRSTPFKFAFPNSGLAVMPEDGTVALMHRQGISLVPLPQSVQREATTSALQDWGWNSLNLTSGDWVRLAVPAGGAVLEQPLLLGNDLVISGRAAATSRKGAGRRLLQQSAKLQCGRGVASAVVIRSPGAVLEQLTVSGCRSAVDVRFDTPSGQAARPVVLSNVSLTANTGPAGAALRVGPGVSLELRDCDVSANTAADGGSVVQAGAQSKLLLRNVTVTDNRGGGVSFAGSRLDVANCSFVGNAALGDANGGALRLLNARPGPDGDSSTATIKDSTFRANRAGGSGGALFLGRSTAAQLVAVSFNSNHAASDGGAVLADLDACLHSIDGAAGSAFINNSATGSGGALALRNPSCNLTIKHASFLRNQARGGGGVFLDELTRRAVRGSNLTFDSNTALDGRGGAIYLGMWNSSAEFDASVFSGNRAAQDGGAIGCEVVGSRVVLLACNASNNTAGLLAGGRSSAAASGGAISLIGRDPSLQLQGVTASNNTASGQGGALFLDASSGNGSLIMAASSFAGNNASSAGGAAAVLRARCSISGAAFEANALSAGDAAARASLPLAGGCLYCLQCSNLSVTASSFERCSGAAFGGGAALLQAQGPAELSNLSFTSSSAVGALPVLGSSGDQVTQLQNGLGDPGSYAGGGGLYITPADACSMRDLTFHNCSATNGGAVLANVLHARARLLLERVRLLASNQAVGGTGGGLLLVGSVQNVTLADCRGSRRNTSAQARCIEQALHQLRADASATCGNGRCLLQDAAEDAAEAAAGAIFATNAVRLQAVSRMPGSDGSPRFRDQDASKRQLAATGNKTTPPIILQLRDALDRPVTGNISDASMRIGANIVAGGTNGPLLGAALLGNVTTAQGGIATFSDLQIWLPDTDLPLQLAFDSVPRSLEQQERFPLAAKCLGCTVGQISEPLNEADRASNASGNCSVPAKCKDCQAPAFSLWPKAIDCIACPKLAECGGWFVLPKPGAYQSHPRSPQIHECLLPAACMRSKGQQVELAGVAAKYRYTQSIPDDAMAGYAHAMCWGGYEGPLCGACAPHFGRTGTACTHCASRVMHGVFYLLVCLLCVLWVLCQGWLHVKQVEKNHVQQAQRLRQQQLQLQQQQQQQQQQGRLPEALSLPAMGRRGPPAEHVPLTASLSTGRVPDAPAAALAAAPSPPKLREASSASEGLSGDSLTLASPWASAPGPAMSGSQSSKPAGSFLAGQSAPLASSDSKTGSFIASLFSTHVLPEREDSTFSPRLQSGSSTALPGQPLLQPHAQARQQQQHFWIADLFKLLTSHLQILGLLRLLRISWPSALRFILESVDTSSAVTSWARLDCSLSDSGGVRRSLKRSVLLLLSPVAAILALTLVFGAAIAVKAARGMRPRLQAYRPYFVLYCVLLLFYVYPQVSREIVSVFSCQRVDDAAALRTQLATFCPRCNVSAEMAVLQHTGRHWSSDTLVVCWSGPHLALVLALGVPGLVFFCLGVPLGLWALMAHSRRGGHMRERMTELQFGFLYASYRSRFYYWECVVLLQKLALVLGITLLQGQSVTLQCLMALAILVVDAMLQVIFRPFACRLLDTMQRLSFYTLELTLFLLIVTTLEEVASDDTRLWALVVTMALNALLLLLFVVCIGLEVKRMLLAKLDRDAKGHLTWADVTWFWSTHVSPRILGVCARGSAARTQSMSRSGAAGSPSRWPRGCQDVAASGSPPRESRV